MVMVGPGIAELSRFASLHFVNVYYSIYIYIYIHINTHPYIFHHLSDILVFDVYIYICISTLHVYLYLHIYISIQDETAHVGP